ncbi:MAG TPA: T9SS type A sorting domain-containing protein [Ferruginibacter sp.]|nr:T9SS type A sorting domain-containing protein [Ferruginibacter sp.]
MAFIRCCITTAVFAFCMLHTQAQTVFYPQGSSQLLKSTAEDAAMLLQKAIKSSQFSIQTYNTIPSAGLIFIYDSTITDNQACKVQSDGTGIIKFTASQDNGLCFGIYQYLQNLGFRFYQPGSIWEIIPSLSSPYKKIDSIYTSSFKYKTWFVSGGHNRWAMDNSTTYSWDSYFGDNGHNWALYQRRNGMVGTYRFSGHRADIMTGNYLSSLQNNPCYVACFNNSRSANTQSVPDVNNQASMNLWSATIEQKYTQYKTNIFSNRTLYVNQYRNFDYANRYIGIEVPDGARWGNSTDNSGCQNTGYSKESDQQFTLANHTAQRINALYPAMRFQVYAYSTHADVPSPGISISDNIDVQLIPAVYQNLTSANGLRKRWLERAKNISEYNYLNLSNWSGETPAFYLNDLKATVQLAKDKKNQGLVWEASPAKFASLPYLLAANNYLLNDKAPIDNTLQEFCNDMFAGGGKTIYNLLQFWADDKHVTGGMSNKYRIPLYLQMIAEAESKTQNEPEVVKDRIRELKAYIHYMVLYYNWAGDQRSNDAKMDKAAALCVYLAKTNRMQLVNSYYMIAVIASKYPAGSSFYQQYNNANGSAYQNGNLPLLTPAEIDNNFQSDVAAFGGVINAYKFEAASFVKDKFFTGNISALKKINVQLKYTSGQDYYNRSEFMIQAPAAGNFTINYKPTFDMTGKGYINFTVESTERTLDVIRDFSLDRNAGAGSLVVALPSAGNYKLTVSSKYQSAVELEILTNKNIFYKSGTFFGKATEIYSSDMASMPGYFYVPAALSRIYFSMNNSYAAGTGFATEEKVNNAFAFTDNNSKILKARFVTPTDSSLFYIDIPQESRGKFCRITKKGGYDLVFANISNLLWYAAPQDPPCGNASFSISVINRNGNCITQLTANSNAVQPEWEISDMGRTLNFSNQSVVELPDYISPNAIVTLSNGSNCSAAKRIGDDAGYLKAKQACASGAPLPARPSSGKAALYPNPSTGVFSCLQNGSAQTATDIILVSPQGTRIGSFKNVKQFDISNAPAGLYLYKMLINGEEFTGKLVKL